MNNQNRPNNASSVNNYNPYQMTMDPLHIIVSSIFNSNANYKDISKKIIISCITGLIYSQIGKHSIDVTKVVKFVVLYTLYSFRFKTITFKKGIEIVETSTNDRMDITQMNKYLNIDVKTYIGFYVKRILGHVAFVKAEDNFVEIICFNTSFKKKFIDECKLKPVVNSFITNYNVLTTSYDHVSKVNSVKTTWVQPSKITSLINYSSNTEFYEMIENYIVKSHILKDNSTLAINVNGKPGVGKSTILDIIYSKNIVNSIYKMNMMNFQQYSDDFESIILKMICTINNKSDNEIWLICFDEMDKWKVLWTETNMNLFLEEKHGATEDEIKRYRHSLNVKFYNTLQRFLDGEFSIKVNRYIVMFFTNFEEHIWGDDVPDNYISVKDRFQMHTFEYCSVIEVICHLKNIFDTLHIYGKADKYDDSIYDRINKDVRVPYRRLKMVINKNIYNLNKIIDDLNKEHVNTKITSNVTYPKFVGSGINTVGKERLISVKKDEKNIEFAEIQSNINIPQHEKIITDNNKNSKIDISSKNNSQLLLAYSNYDEYDTMNDLSNVLSKNNIYMMDGMFMLYGKFFNNIFLKHNPKCKIYYVDQKINEVEIIYSVDSDPPMEYKFVISVKDNVNNILQCFINNNITHYVEYSNNKSRRPNGLYITYHKGNIKYYHIFKGGRPEGEWRYYYKNGNLSCKENYINGMASGEHYEYYKDGSVKIFRNYDYDAMDGECLLYSKDGDIKRRVYYDKGKFLYSIENGVRNEENFREMKDENGKITSLPIYHLTLDPIDDDSEEEYSDIE